MGGFQRLSGLLTLLFLLQGVALASSAWAVTLARTDDPPPGTVQILTSQTQSTSEFQNCSGPACAALDFLIQTDTYRVFLPSQSANSSISYGTRSYVKYQTRDLAHLEDFGVAQFIRGCQYTSKIVNGVVQKIQDVSYDLDGKVVDYHFPTFIIDGFVKDPLDWGDDPNAASRHAYYKWNEIPGSFDPKTEHWEGQTPATNPALYVTDHPGTAFFSIDTNSARNISVQFRTCLYKTADVSRDVSPTNLNFAVPMACFDWSSSFIYDFATAAETSPVDIDPFCK